MKLNSEQVTFIENYISTFQIKYYEVYMEILDHMILSVEAIIEEDKMISFEKAVIKAKVEGFGKYSFREIEEEKVLLINKKQRKSYRNHLKTYFTFPYFVFTIFIFSSSYFFLNLFEKPQKIVYIILFPLVLYCLIDWTKQQFKFGKKNNFKILKMQNFAYLMNLVLIWMYLLNSIGIFGFENLNDSLVYKIFSSFVITMSVLSFLFYITFSKTLKQEIQQQIFV